MDEKEIKEPVENVETKEEPKQEVQKLEFRNVKKTDDDWQNAFVALLTSVLQQSFVSETSKLMIIKSMFMNLKYNGYTDTDLSELKINMKAVVDRIQFKTLP